MTFKSLRDNPSVGQLTRMLRFSRPDLSDLEASWVHTFVTPSAPEQDDFGNHHLAIPEKDGSRSRVAFSCHTDTVSAYVGLNKLKKFRDQVRLAEPRAGRCLGADDGAGVWLALELIAARKPGLYLFHRAEERGGLGSSFIADHNRGLLDGIDFAIALDRRGFGDVITHQVGGRTASDAFARQLAGKLGRGYAPSDKGVFTDTANYADFIAECTNISVGYDHEHGPRETLDLGHLQRLRDALVRADLSDLEPVRAPGDYDLTLQQDPSWWTEDLPGLVTSRRSFDESFIGLIRDYPEAAVEALRAEGWTEADFESFILRSE